MIHVGEQFGDEFFWNPVRDAGMNRLLFLARFLGEPRRLFEFETSSYGLSERLGRHMFPENLRHQSVSDRYRDTPYTRRAMMEAGSRLKAESVLLQLDRIHCSGSKVDAHWEIRGPNSQREHLVPLVSSLNSALVVAGLPAGGGHRPHISICYGGTTPLNRDLYFTKILWSIDEIELVVGGGRPYAYETIGRWALEPERGRVSQSALFSTNTNT
jgi:RNA 2',3'-cyclic 3'-phosphodiesterase